MVDYQHTASFVFPSQAARLEAAQQCRQRQLLGAQLEVIGSGTMQWSRDRDRCVNVSDGVCSSGLQRS